MSGIYQLIKSIFQLGIFLSASYGIVRATAYMANEAARVHEGGMVSLHRMNHSLVGTGASFARPAHQDR